MEKTNPVFQTLTIIEERLQEKLTVEALAESIHFSKYHYQRQFRELVGESVMRYTARRRLSLAAEALSGTDDSILDIALRYGYESHEGFTRSFRAYAGITPTEYRKYHTSIHLLKTQKERCAMLYSKAADGIIKELNGLIVQARETAAYTRQNSESNPETAPYYNEFWKCIAERADIMADELSSALSRITSIPQRPDEISARFVILKAIEDTVFQSHVTAFQARLTISRANLEHRAILEPLCSKYESLAQNAQIKSEKTAEFFQELSALIFQDMRDKAKDMLGKAAAKGREAAQTLLKNPALPYTYIGDEVKNVADELASVPLEEVTVSLLEDLLFRLGIIISAAEIDVLRHPDDRPLFEGLSGFMGQLQEAAAFFQSLSKDFIREMPEEKHITPGRSIGKVYQDMAFQWNILLFYLKGEIQKLGSHLNREQKEILLSACCQLDKAIHLAQTGDGANGEEISGIVQDVCGNLEAEAKKLAICGAPVQFIASEIAAPLKHIQK